MKTKWRRFSSVVFATLILFTIVGGCNVFENDNSIEGSWFQESVVESPLAGNVNLIQRLEVTFSADHSFESRRIVVDGSTDTILGYRFASRGEYSLLDDKLSMRTIESFSSDDVELYVPLGELKPVTNVMSIVVTFKVDGDKMTWRYPPCPEDADCLDTQTFLRKP